MFNHYFIQEIQAQQTKLLNAERERQMTRELKKGSQL